MSVTTAYTSPLIEPTHINGSSTRNGMRQLMQQNLIEHVDGVDWLERAQFARRQRDLEDGLQVLA